MLYVQYAQSKNFQSLLYGGENIDGEFAGLNTYLNIYWRDFYDQIFNILTATEYGLNVWGQILNTGKQYFIGTQDSTFGYDVVPVPLDLIGYAQNYDQGSYSFGDTFSIMSIEQYRCLLILRARTFISNGSILSITTLLNDFFINLQDFASGDGEDYYIAVTVSQDLTTPYQVNYNFKHTVTPSSTLPYWISAIFFTNVALNAYYLPIPIGGFPNITIT